jgi:hypothetical protein
MLLTTSTYALLAALEAAAVDQLLDLPAVVAAVAAHAWLFLHTRLLPVAHARSPLTAATAVARLEPQPVADLVAVADLSLLFLQYLSLPT